MGFVVLPRGERRHVTAGSGHGDPNRTRKPRPMPEALVIRSEHDEQVAVIRYRDAHPQDHPVRLLYAVPNGGDRHRIVAAKLRAEGVTAGVPDLCLPVARGAYHGLYIEMKRRKASPSAVNAAQLLWHRALRAQDYRVEVCRGSDEAIELLAEYLRLPVVPLPREQRSVPAGDTHGSGTYRKAAGRPRVTRGKSNGVK